MQVPQWFEHIHRKAEFSHTLGTRLRLRPGSCALVPVKDSVFSKTALGIRQEWNFLGLIPVINGLSTYLINILTMSQIQLYLQEADSLAAPSEGTSLMWGIRSRGRKGNLSILANKTLKLITLSCFWYCCCYHRGFTALSQLFQI